MILGFPFSRFICVVCQQLLYQLSSILFLNPNEPALSAFLCLVFRNPVMFSSLITADSFFWILEVFYRPQKRPLIPFPSTSSGPGHTFHCLCRCGAEGAGWTGALAALHGGDCHGVSWQQPALSPEEGCCTGEKAVPWWRDFTALCHKIVMWLIHKSMIAVDASSAPRWPWVTRNGWSTSQTSGSTTGAQ